MAKYHGKAGQVYIASSGTGTASAVIGLTSWSVDMSTAKAETTAFGDTNKTYVQGLPDIKGKFSGMWDDTESKLFTGRSSADGIKMYLYPNASGAVSKYLYGPAWIDASIDVGVDGAVKLSGDFVANGAWGVNL